MEIERIVPGTIEWDAFYANHIMRYQFATSILKTESALCILDAACGVGYGTKELANMVEAKKVIGIDLSDGAIKTAETKFKASKIIFLQDDCHKLTSASLHGPFDSIVSFETLEHLPKPIDFLNCCFSNLKSNGKIIISTPNKLVSSPDELNWKYHEKEYTADELCQLLQLAGFRNIKLYGQQYSMKGKIKMEIRGDLNRLFSNPFVRLGKWLQFILKGYKNNPVLKEAIDDFEIVGYDEPAKLKILGENGPFVLIAVADK